MPPRPSAQWSGPRSEVRPPTPAPTAAPVCRPEASSDPAARGLRRNCCICCCRCEARSACPGSFCEPVWSDCASARWASFCVPEKSWPLCCRYACIARCASFCVPVNCWPALLQVAGQVPLGLALGAREILAALLQIRLSCRLAAFSRPRIAAAGPRSRTPADWRAAAAAAAASRLELILRALEPEILPELAGLLGELGFAAARDFARTGTRPAHGSTRSLSLGSRGCA